MHATARLVTFLALVSNAWGKLKYLGVAMPGIDFGCDIDGSCPTDTSSVPLTKYGGGDGAGQMKHFAEDDGMNMFRLSATWQFLLNNKLGGKLDSTYFPMYDDLVQACLDTGAYCIIDVHNFARYNGGIIGQGGPTDDVFVDLWTQIATYYVKNDRVVFGLMNEPHDLDINIWAKTCQKLVTAIRKAGATSHLILLPGTNFASAETFVSTGSADALAAITNPDGSTDNLYLDVHKYLDINNSGTHVECTTNNVDAFNNLASWLRKNKRQAIISETGASMDPSCMTNFCEQNQAINNSSDVYVGFVGWGAGSFDETYILTLTPLGSPGSYTDNKLMKQCILGEFGKGPGPAPVSSSTPSKTTASTPSSTDQILQETSSASPSTTALADSNAKSSDSKSGSVGSVGSFAGGLVLTAIACFHTLLHFI